MTRILFRSPNRTHPAFSKRSFEQSKHQAMNRGQIKVSTLRLFTFRWSGARVTWNNHIPFLWRSGRNKTPHLLEIASNATRKGGCLTSLTRDCITVPRMLPSTVEPTIQQPQALCFLYSCFLISVQSVVKMQMKDKTQKEGGNRSSD